MKPKGNSEFQHSPPMCLSEPLQENQSKQSCREDGLALALCNFNRVTRRMCVLLDFPLFQEKPKARIWTYNYLIRSRRRSSPLTQSRSKHSSLPFKFNFDSQKTDYWKPSEIRAWKRLLVGNNIRIFSKRQRGNRAVWNFCFSADN